MSSYNKEADKKYYEKHKEERKEQSKRYHECHKEADKEYHKKYYEEHSEVAKENSKKYYYDHADSICLKLKEKFDTMPHKDKEIYLAYHRKYYQEHKEKCLKVSSENRRKKPEQTFKYTLKATYGLAVEDYYKMLEEQNNVCAICHKPERKEQHGKVQRLSVDHDHKTGKIRGLLCSYCNVILQGFKDDKEVFKRAYEYLERNE